MDSTRGRFGWDGPMRTHSADKYFVQVHDGRHFHLFIFPRAPAAPCL